MRYCSPRLKLAARCCCSIAAITLSTLLGSSLEAVQVSDGYNTTAFSGYGMPPAEPVAQDYSTSRPMHADPTGDSYQSMSPDSWGNSAPIPTNPIASPVPASALRNQGIARYPLSTRAPESSSSASSSGAYSTASAANATGQMSSNQFSPGYQYKSTGAPSMRAMLGERQTNQSSTPVPAASVPARSPFRSMQFGLQDPKDIPLAPTIPSSILDENDNRLDLVKPDVVDNVLPPAAEETSPMDGPELEAPPQPSNQPIIAPPLMPNSNSILQTPEAPSTDLQPPLTPASEHIDNSFQSVESTPYPQTNAQPFASTTAQPYPQTTAQPFGSTMIQPYAQTNAQPFASATNQPIAPYQMPQVFEAAPANAPMLAPTIVDSRTNASNGFGWGNAPGMFQKRSQQGVMAQPGLTQQFVTQPQFSQTPFAPQAEPSRPKFPLPFGMNPKSLGKMFESKKVQLDLEDSTHGKKRFGKPVDPNTYPPQPVAHSQPPISPSHMPSSQFRPDLAQRSPLPTVRNAGTYDSGATEYDFENKKREFPPFSEILATGKYFAAIEGQFVKPRFNGNSGLAISNSSGGTNFTDSQVFDFDFEFIPSFRAGFESKYGPGFEVDYRNLRTASVVQSFTSGAASSASLRAALPDVSLTSVISTMAPGQTLSGAHTFNLESYGFSVFKAVQLPVTRISGSFGFQALDIDHQVDATVVDGAGTVLQSLFTQSDMRAYGPRIRIDYFRPVGHTRLEFLSQAGGSVLFGKRDQRISGQGIDSFQRIGTDEIVTTFEFLTALQIRQRVGENRSMFGRIGFLNQSFNSGGSGFLPQDDFGLRGITVQVGINQ